MECNFIKVHTGRDLAISTIVILLGVGLSFINMGLGICKTCRTSLMDFLEGRNPTPTIQRGHEGGTVRLDVYYNKAENVAYVQLYDFCNYVYEPATGIIELNGDRAAKLISLF